MSKNERIKVKSKDERLDPTKWMIVVDAAKYVGVTRESVYRWIRDGRVTSEKQWGQLLVLKSDLDRRLAFNQIVHAREGGDNSGEEGPSNPESDVLRGTD